ncbi:hypothetical protein BGW80DRAFT_549365 [Lactifluus volemus]|nr:hypothetical protein BGW80DRAFT_549365 [Lactifluus volemus]
MREWGRRSLRLSSDCVPSGLCRANRDPPSTSNVSNTPTRLVRHVQARAREPDTVPATAPAIATSHCPLMDPPPVSGPVTTHSHDSDVPVEAPDALSHAGTTTSSLIHHVGRARVPCMRVMYRALQGGGHPVLRAHRHLNHHHHQRHRHRGSGSAVYERYMSLAQSIHNIKQLSPAFGRFA